MRAEEERCAGWMGKEKASDIRMSLASFSGSVRYRTGYSG